MARNVRCDNAKHVSSCNCNNSGSSYSVDPCMGACAFVCVNVCVKSRQMHPVLCSCVTRSNLKSGHCLISDVILVRIIVAVTLCNTHTPTDERYSVLPQYLMDCMTMTCRFPSEPPTYNSRVLLHGDELVLLCSYEHQTTNLICKRC